MKKKVAVTIFTFALVLTSLSGCGKNNDNGENSTNYVSGVYTGQSSEDDRGAFGEVTITIEENKITDCQYVTWKEDGTLKDENYGKGDGGESNKDLYDKAQVAVAAMGQYAQQLVEVQKLEDVDGISGATVTYNQFNEAVGNALSQATESK